MAYWILRKTLIPIIKALFIKQITGIERLPKKGAFIIALNHSSYIDSIILAAVLLPRLKKPLHFIAMKPLKKYWISRLVLGKYFGSIFVNGAVDEAVAQLKKGEIIIIFPEGGRTPDGEIKQPAGSGTAIISALSNAPVIPTAITGAFELWPRQKTLPKLKKMITVNFGKKIPSLKKNTQKEIKKYMNKIMHSIVKLCKKRYYANEY